MRMECAPAFNYARDKHGTKLVQDETSNSNSHLKAVFKSAQMTLDLRYVAESVDDKPVPNIQLKPLDLTSKGHLGYSVSSDFVLHDGEAVTFVLRQPPEPPAQQPQQPSRHGVVEGIFEEIARFMPGSHIQPKPAPRTIHSFLRTS